MVEYPKAAQRQYKLQQQIAALTVASAGKLWRKMGPEFDASWLTLRPQLLEVVTAGRLATVNAAVDYTPQLLAETGQVAPAYGTLAPESFIEFTPQGGSVATLLDVGVVKAKMAVGAGASAPEALARSGSWLTGTLLTVMADTRRNVYAADLGQRPAITGYVRMLNAPSCSRCVILAGKFFRWNQGFQRHPRCDCLHVASSNEKWARDEGYISDPYEYFNSLSTEDQDKLFRPHNETPGRAAQIGKSNARAIRDGGDIYRIENVRLRGLGTAKANLRYGTPSRMTVDDIYRTAGTRTNAVKMMEREGYITGPQVAGGNVLGLREGFGALGKGGNARAASNAVTAARESGVRDPLNRYTMTAAERRLYDSKFRLDEARRTGNWPRSIGQNSADKYVNPTPLAPGDLTTLEQAFLNERAKLPQAAPSVLRLAELLGIQ